MGRHNDLREGAGKKGPLTAKGYFRRCPHLPRGTACTAPLPAHGRKLLCTVARGPRSAESWVGAASRSENQFRSSPAVPIPCGRSIVRQPRLLNDARTVRRVIFAQGQRVNAAAKVAWGEPEMFRPARCS